MATGGKQQESLEQRESETVKMGKSKHKKESDDDMRKMILEGHIQIAERRWEELKETQRLNSMRATATPRELGEVRDTDAQIVDQTWQNIFISGCADEVEERRRDLQDFIRDNSLKTHTKGSVVNREHSIPDTVAVKQDDPGLEPTDASTQTPSNQQTQKTLRPGIGNFSQATRGVREIGQHNNESTNPQKHSWEQPTLPPVTRSKRREHGERDQGMLDNQEGGHSTRIEAK